jgi:anti-sigma factor RsiW
MTATSGSVRKFDLHAFVDGQLDAERRRTVAAHLGENPDAARRVEAYQRQKKALRAMLDPVLEETLPRGLRAPRPMRRMVHVAWAAAAAILLVVGCFVGWEARDYSGAAGGADAIASGEVAREAAVAHAVFTAQRRHPVEVKADEEAHLVTWLSNVLGAPLRAPHLAGLGYSLVGGRLLSSTDGPAAQFMYEDAKKHRLTLYVVNNAAWQGKAEFQFAEERGVSVFYWIEGTLGYALSGEIDRPALLSVANAVYKQLER